MGMYGWHDNSLIAYDLTVDGTLTFGDAATDNLIIKGRVSSMTVAGSAIGITSSYTHGEGIELRYEVTGFSGSSFKGMYLRAEAATNAATAKSIYGAEIYGVCNNVTMTTGSLWGTLTYAYVKGAGAVTIENMYAVQGELSWDASRTGDCTITTAAACFRAKITGGRVADYTKIDGYVLTIGEMDGDSQRFGNGLLMQDDADMSGTSTLTTGINITIGCTTGISISGSCTTGIDFSSATLSGYDIILTTSGSINAATAVYFFVSGTEVLKLRTTDCLFSNNIPLQFEGASGDADALKISCDSSGDATMEATAGSVTVKTSGTTENIDIEATGDIALNPTGSYVTFGGVSGGAGLINIADTNIKLYGGDTTGDDLFLYPNSADVLTESIMLHGGSDVTITSTTKINLDGPVDISGAIVSDTNVTTGVTLSADYTMGISISSSSVARGIDISATATTGIKIGDACTTGINIGTAANAITITGTTTTAIAISGATTTGIAIGTDALKLSLATNAARLQAMYSTSSLTTGAINTFTVSQTMTALSTANQIEVAQFILTSDVKTGTWANAILGKIDYSANGLAHGIAGVICSEIDLPSTTAVVRGTYCAWETEINCPTGCNMGGNPIYVNRIAVWGGAETQFDAVGYLFEITGVSSGASSFWYDNPKGAPQIEEFIRVKTPSGTRYLALYDANA